MALVQFSGGSGGGGGGTITGSGTANTFAIFTGATAIGNSVLTTNGTHIILGATNGIAFGGVTASDGKLMQSGAFSGVGVDVLAGDSSAYGSIRALSVMIAAVNAPLIQLSSSARGIALVESSTFTDLEAGSATFFDDTATTGATTVLIKAGAGQSTTEELLLTDDAGANPVGIKRLGNGILGITDGAGTETARFVSGATAGGGGLRTASAYGSGDFYLGANNIAQVWSITAGDSYNLAPAGDLFYGLGSPSHRVSSAYIAISIQSTSSKTLTETVATGFVDIALAQNTVVGGVIEYTVRTTDGTDYSVESGEIFFTGASKTNGTIDDADVGAVGTPIQSTTTANVWTNVFTVTKGTNKLTVNCNSTSSLAGTDVITIFYRVHINSGTATVTPL